MYSRMVFVLVVCRRFSLDDTDKGRQNKSVQRLAGRCTLARQSCPARTGQNWARQSRTFGETPTCSCTESFKVPPGRAPHSTKQPPQPTNSPHLFFWSERKPLPSQGGPPPAAIVMPRREPVENGGGNRHRLGVAGHPAPSARTWDGYALVRLQRGEPPSP